MVDVLGSDPRRHPCGLIAKRTQAYVANAAVSGPGRAEIDAYARQMGYPVNAIPLIPIQGPFVRDHKGVFDIQAQVTAFLNSRDAQGYAEELWRAAQGANWVPLSLKQPGARGGGSVAGEAPYQDWASAVAWRQEALVIYLSVDGTRTEVEDQLSGLIDVASSNANRGPLHGTPPASFYYGT